MCMVWVLTWALCPPANNHSTVQSCSVNSLQFNMSTAYLGKQKGCQKSVKTCCMTLIRQHSHIWPPVLSSMSLSWISIILAFNVIIIPLMAFLMESFNIWCQCMIGLPIDFTIGFTKGVLESIYCYFYFLSFKIITSIYTVHAGFSRLNTWKNNYSKVFDFNLSIVIEKLCNGVAICWSLKSNDEP